MDAPAHKPAPPIADGAAMPLAAGVLCYRCGYDLVDRVPGEPCPECGVDVAASWPPYALGDCHAVFLEHLGGEVGRLLGAASMGALGAAFAAGGACVGGLPTRADWKAMVVFALLAAAIIAGGGALGNLIRTASELRRHPNRAQTPGAATRRVLFEGVLLIAAGLFITLTLGVMSVGVAVQFGAIVAAIGAIIVCTGLVMVYVNALDYTAQALDRAGGRRGALAWEAIVALLPLVAAPLVFPAALGMMPWWWVFAGAMAGVACALSGLSVRAWRAQRAIHHANIAAGGAGV